MLTDQLSTVDKARLIERLAPQITSDLKRSQKKPRKSLRGLWRTVRTTPAEIDQARQELWRTFPREDI
jgi:hypothetical protein